MSVNDLPCAPCQGYSPTPIVPACSNPEYCAEVIADKCVIHKGTTLTNISAVDGVKLDAILTVIDTKIGTISSIQTAPISATAIGTAGQIVLTAGFIYVCIATNVWVRAALTTF